MHINLLKFALCYAYCFKSYFPMLKIVHKFKSSLGVCDNEDTQMWGERVFTIKSSVGRPGLREKTTSVCMAESLAVHLKLSQHC